MIKSIQLAIDSSKYAEVATDHALELTKRLDAMLDVVYVINENCFNVPYISESGYVKLTSNNDIRILFEEQGEHLLEKVKERALQQGLRCRTECREGDPATEILATAKDCDLIVMGKRGESQLEPSPPLGTVTLRVMKTTTQPVLFTPKQFKPVKRIVFGYDGSEPSLSAMHYACEVASRLAIPLVAVTAHHDKAEAVKLLETVDRYASAFDLAFESRVLSGTPEKAILQEAKPNDLIAVGAYGKKGIRKWLLGSTAELLLRDATQAVLIHR